MHLSLRIPALALAFLLPAASIAPPAAAKSPPPAPTLSEKQEQALSKGKIVIVDGLDPERPDGVRAMGILDIDAKPNQVWAALYDWNGREEDSANAKKVVPFDEQRNGSVRSISVTWHIEVLGNKLQYTNRYTHWVDSSYLEFRLDERKPNDLSFNWGSYHVAAHPTDPNKTRFYYTTEADSGRTLPDWVKTWLTKTGLKDMLKQIRDRAAAKAPDITY